MKGSHENPLSSNKGDDRASDEGSFIGRWSRRKQNAAGDAVDTAHESDVDNDLIDNDLIREKSDHPLQADDSSQAKANPPDDAESSTVPALTDADMPDIETLNSDSDFSPFFSEGVSKELRNLALKKLFFSGMFAARDGLDDYDDDFTRFEPLGDTITSDMKYHAKRKEKARLAKLEEEERLRLENAGEENDEQEVATAEETDDTTVDDTESLESEAAVVDDHHEDSTPAHAALEEMSSTPPGTTIEFSPSNAIQTTSLVGYQSRGHCLIIGPMDLALEVAARLDTPAQTVLVPTPGKTDFNKQATEDGVIVVEADALLLKGYLGAFDCAIGDTESPGSLAMVAGVSLLGGFDLVLDLGDLPMLRQEVLPFGYMATGSNEALIDAAVVELAELQGDFEKPKYFEYDSSICAHSRSSITACTNCIDVCGTGAITSDGDGVKIEPYLCQGCGSCATRLTRLRS